MRIAMVEDLDRSAVSRAMFTVVNMEDGHQPDWWCMACAEETGLREDPPHFYLKPIYRTHRIPADARCEECGISIRELAESFTEMLDGIEADLRARR